MGELIVHVLSEDDWTKYRDVRLAALEEAPAAFVNTLAEERDYDEAFWRLRMTRSVRLLATRDDTSLGVVSVGGPHPEEPRLAELFGLWVSPPARGTGVATALVQAGADTAATHGRSQLAYWVGSENARAIGFASGFGFRPTDIRRPVHVREGQEPPEGVQEFEVMMVLALGADRGQPTPVSTWTG